MTGWVILVDQPKDFPNAETPHKVITTSDYLARPKLFEGRPKLVNLSRSYAYQSKGYYASLLAEARAHRVVPTVETMLELREVKLYEHALPELEEELNRCARKADFQPEGEFRFLVCFGIAHDPRFESFGRLLFDWFRCPALEITVEPGQRLSIDRIRPRTVTRLANGEAAFFRECLHQHTKREWRDPKGRSVAKYDLAVLHDPNEKIPPSSVASISAPSPRRPSTTPAILSDSLTRSSCAPRTIVSPSAKQPSSATSGSSSIASGTSSGSTTVLSSAPWATSRSLTGSSRSSSPVSSSRSPSTIPCIRRRMRRKPVRVQLTPTSPINRREWGTSTPAVIRKAAELASPGTRTLSSSSSSVFTTVT